MQDINAAGDQNMMELHINLLIFQQDEFYVSFCPSLNLSSYGQSIQDAKDGFDEVMEAFIEDSTTNKTLFSELEKHGWSLLNHHHAEPPQAVELDIPGGQLRKQFNQKWSVPVGAC